MTTCSPHPDTSTPPPLAPRAIREAGVVVVGAGPAGLLAAILLDQRGIPVTLLEQCPNIASFQIARAYPQSIFVRGCRVLASVPNLLPFISRHGLIYGSRFMHINPQGGVRLSGARVTSRPQQRKAKQEGANYTAIRLMRSALLQALFRFIEINCPLVTVVSDAPLQAVDFSPDSEMTLHTGSVSNPRIKSRFVIACDGSRSTVLSELRRVERGKGEGGSDGDDGDCGIVSSGGLKEESFELKTTALRRKGLVISRRLRRYISERTEVDWGPTQPPTIIVEGCGETAGMRSTCADGTHEAFNFVVYATRPDGEDEMEEFKGIEGDVASVILPKDHSLWKVRDVEEAYDLFQRNFAQVPDIPSLISTEAMESFVHAKEAGYGIARWTRSLAACVGRNGGVVLIGDAAHSFPPDLGQGVNAALEDVGVLARVMDMSVGDASVQEVCQGYEKVRREDIEGLMFAIRQSTPFQHCLDVGSRRRRMWNFKMRMKLSRRFPGTFAPAASAMLAGPTAYAEIRRRAMRTTRMLWMVGGGVAGLVATVAMAVARVVAG